jgi:hypothetical protein
VSWIPGWASIADAGWWSGFYFWVSIGCLLGLGASEIASHRYSERKEELSAIEQESIQRRHDEDMARVQHDAARLSAEAEIAKAAIAEANARAAEANRQAAEAALQLEKLKTPRSISPKQQAELTTALLQFSGQPYTLSVTSDDEATQLLRAIAGILKGAGWKQLASQMGDLVFQLEGVEHPAGLITATGVRVHVKPDASDEIVKRAVLLSGMLNAVGIAAITQKNKELKVDGAINIAVGAKPLSLPLHP